MVQNLGPLWAHSCFPFESANGDILQLFHGSQGVEKQVRVFIHVASVYTCTAHFLVFLFEGGWEPTRPRVWGEGAFASIP